VIIVRTVDNAGNETTSQLTVIRDNTAPTITIGTPSTTPFTTLSPTIAINGTASDPSTDASVLRR
jgi:hypothetical protein